MILCKLIIREVSCLFVSGLGEFKYSIAREINRPIDQLPSGFSRIIVLLPYSGDVSLMGLLFHSLESSALYWLFLSQFQSPVFIVNHAFGLKLS
jgi:hypothetical protein